MKFAEGLVSSLLLSLPPSRLPVRPPSPSPPLPLPSVPLAPLPPGPFTTPSKSLFSLLLLPPPLALPATTNYPVTTESRISPTCFK